MEMVLMNADDLRLMLIEATGLAVRNNVTAVSPTSPEAPTPKPLSVQGAAEFLGIAPQTVYQNIKKIPHHKRLGRLYFFEVELLAYLKGENV